ncbi:HprK-related kinase A [Vibrio sp. MA40-2]|uniref:HprK-related kinase A n=1 Tax=Vibrio sp. MA40-2 TaxID=3391828 RepID=UPI0039A6F2DB
MSKTYTLQVGPFRFSIKTDIKAVQTYLQHHYQHNLFSADSTHFIDYHVAIEHGPLYRRKYKPQALFTFNQSAPFKPLPLDQAHAMLEWGMNWVISSQANNYYIIHAATLEKEGKGIIISAPSGSGKSTLCAYLVSQGWRLLSDELALLSPDTLDMVGLARPINLKNKSIQLMKPYFSTSDFSATAIDTHKGSISLIKPPLSSCEQAAIPVKPEHIIFVKFNETEKCYVEPVEKCLALTEIVRNSFNFGLLNKLGFDCARRLVSQSEVHYIEYNDFQACEHELLNIINNKCSDTNEESSHD